MNTKKLLFTIILSLFLLCLVVILLIYFQIQKRNQPPGTIQTGVFKSQPIWHYKTLEDITSTPVGDENGQIYIRTENSLIALDIRNGNLLWRAESPSETPLIIAPKIFDNKIVVPERDSRIAAFSTTGNFLWKSPILEKSISTPWIEAITYNNGLIYVARFDWTLAAYDIENGQIKWEQNISSRYPPYLAYKGNTIYLGQGSILKAFDAKSGNLLWQKELSGSIGPMALENDTLFISDIKFSSLIAIELTGQEIIWRKYYNSAINGSEIGCLVAHGQNLFLAAEEMMVISSADGEKIWLSNKTERLECPIIMNDVLYVRNTNTLLYAFDLISGKELGRLNVQGNTPMKHEPDRSPIAFDGFLVIPISDHEIYAYRP